MFLEAKGRLPCGTTWKRRAHEPWFLDVMPSRVARERWERIKEVPGVAVDGYTKCWVMPEEVFVLYVMGESDERP